jgi:putative spermidine/putrescine transport system substrate-binding protein
LYPGPAIRNVPLEMAPQQSQDIIKRFGRPEYAALIADNPNEPPLDPKPLLAMFDKWDREIGATK